MKAISVTTNQCTEQDVLIYRALHTFCEKYERISAATAKLPSLNIGDMHRLAFALQSDLHMTSMSFGLPPA